MDATARELLTEILSRIIPGSADMPSAGETDAVDFVASQLDGDGHMARLLSGGIEQINSRSLSQGARFADLPDGSKDDLLRLIEEINPEFFSALVMQTYRGYYTDHGVLGQIGEDLRPPQPSGHSVQRGDLRLLEAVRRRGPIYRNV